MKHIEVVAGVIEHDGKILCMERDQGKYDYVSFKWEFPGGKIEEGETKEEALKRELQEEMERILAEIEADPELRNVEPPEDLHDKVMASIREYEKYKAAKRLLDFVFGSK